MNPDKYPVGSLALLTVDNTVEPVVVLSPATTLVINPWNAQREVNPLIEPIEITVIAIRHRGGQRNYVTAFRLTTDLDA